MATLSDIIDIYSKQKDLIDTEEVEKLRFSQYCQIWLFGVLDELRTGTVEKIGRDFRLPIQFGNTSGLILLSGGSNASMELRGKDFVETIKLPFVDGRPEPLEPTDLGRFLYKVQEQDK